MVGLLTHISRESRGWPLSLAQWGLVSLLVGSLILTAATNGYKNSLRDQLNEMGDTQYVDLHRLHNNNIYVTQDGTIYYVVDGTLYKAEVSDGK